MTKNPIFKEPIVYKSEIDLVLKKSVNEVGDAFKENCKVIIKKYY